MRKFTLLCMSMFFVLGTAMAKDEGAKDFNSPIVNPNSEEVVTSGYNIRLEFSKDIVITLPEGGIDIVNNETKEVVKITRYQVDEWTPKNLAVLQFEQIKVEGKEGKEEWQDQYITTPGTYTYTIPAGVIKSVDGDVFPETTYTFSVVGTFPIESYSPATTNKLESIVLTFAQEITEVKMPSYGLSIVDYYWTPVSTVSNAVISEDKKTVTLQLETPITTPGQYNLDLYQGVFVSAAGISEYCSLPFSVVDYNPSFDTNYKDGERVKEIGDFVITFNNVKEVKLIADKFTLYLPGGGEAEGTAILADNKITVSFNQQFTEDGDYLFHIPAGSFTMDGVQNEERILNLTLFTFTITPLKVTSVTPEVGTVDKLEKIIIRFNQVIQLSYDENWQQISREITLTCGEQTYTLTHAPDYSANASDKLEYLVNATWTGIEYTSTPITADGTYTLDLSSIIVDHAAEEGIDEWGYPATTWHSKNQSCSGTYTWIIGSGVNAIDEINVAEGNQVIYDILGRRVEKITSAGLYIINGKKTIIK